MKHYKKIFLLLFTAMLLCACKNGADTGEVSSASGNETTELAEVTETSVEPVESEEPETEEVRLEDDYYAYQNCDILREHEIPADSGTWSWFYELDHECRTQLLGIITELTSGQETYVEGSREQQIRDLYATALDEDTRNAAGFGNMQQYLDAIDKADTMEAYLDALGKMIYDVGLGSVTSTTVEASAEDSNCYIPHVMAADTVNSKEIFEDQNQKEMLELYQDYIADVLMMLGTEEERAKEDAAEIFTFQKQVASAGLKESEWYDLSKTYNRYTLEELQEAYPNLQFDRLIPLEGYDDFDVYIVDDEGALKATNDFLVEEHLPILKQYSKFIFANDMAGCAGIELRNLYMDYEKKVNGIQESESDELLATNLVMGYFPFDMGDLYVKRYFDEDSKKDVESMVKDIINQYKVRIRSLDWMGEETKEHAVRKLETMQIRIGYPEHWTDYLITARVLSPEQGGSLIDNIYSITMSQMEVIRQKCRQPVDKTEWHMTPQTVNAYYDESDNSINFPAAILQYPFYDKNRSHAENLGGIGAVIGHEISHAFDTSGSQYDEYGNQVVWWTEEDYSNFQERTQAVAEYYDQQVGFQDILVNGEQTLTENIADLGGVAVTLELVGDDPDSLKSYFENYARIWALKATDEYRRLLLNVDVHAPAKVRVNAVLPCMEAFYQAYPEIQEGDGMYLAPEKRILVW